ncbi:DNA repair protein RecO [Thermoleptolyngbya sichuanensis XZ-Cy5]|uniref:DNA repair protein RecO n=1 Tax=Thermoleptolyngbya sichuanensis TaxID=2885951 RepID=UPI00240D46E8|nr:DNA repair protein RecO [Thermoleptolyngbya sichuanensis]MDG2614773.1 DNA repair protein RecO [Thermoleptolyngbya sichuanensis XZ-Cy5]
MSGTYKTVGINLKGMPMGESDRLLTVLTREHGLIRLVAPGSRKHESSLRGRSGLFVVNQLLIAKGRTLDKIIQAEGIEAFTGLSQDLRKLTAGQYLAELALCQALSNQPQDELFTQLSESLRRIEQLPASVTLLCLVQATYQLLTLAGVAPQVHACCVTQQPIVPPDGVSSEGRGDSEVEGWRAGFHAAAGGVVSWEVLSRLEPGEILSENPSENPQDSQNPHNPALASTAAVLENRESLNAAVRPKPKPIKKVKASGDSMTPAAKGRATLAEPEGRYAIARSLPKSTAGSRLGTPISSAELAALQRLSDPELLSMWMQANWMQTNGLPAPASLSAQKTPEEVWLRVERLLRHYAQYHFDRPIQSAALIETCFAAVSPSSCLPTQDATD